ncbi:Octanoyltransferase LipM [Propionispora sp. 2/2-37]|nr:Octanoyltransferase LipM [Propionispora sp. 2/2-37]
MAIDEAIMTAHGEGKVPPTLRFYGWSPATLTLGYFQKAESEVDVKECAHRGIDVVRRLTGGRAVLHDAELTYSIVVREAEPSIPKTITASYRHFSQGLLAGLAHLGITARMSMPAAAYGQVGRKRPSSAACFDSPSHYEITCEGRKLVGSAQVRKHGVILQHGSILLDCSPENLVSVLKLPSPEKRLLMADMLSRRIISIRQIKGRAVSREELRDAIGSEFGKVLGIEMTLGDLTGEERRTAEGLVKTKYGRDEWNLLR